VDGPELPAGDGSALFFADLIRQAGLVSQDKPRCYRVADGPVWVGENGSYLVLLPPERPGLTVSYTFSADARAIGAQYREFCLGVDDFAGEIAPARTIAFIEEIEALRREGLARSEDTELVVVVGPEGYLNERRFPDEVVRHKILDLLGDLYLLGPLHGRAIAIRSGHRLNHRLAQELARTIPALTTEDGTTEGLVL
jgi:UDP-3-O-[3-hydroxymyristoyl] N-acetylglucosamine deacetylase